MCVFVVWKEENKVNQRECVRESVRRRKKKMCCVCLRQYLREKGRCDCVCNREGEREKRRKDREKFVCERELEIQSVSQIWAN